MTLTQLEYVLAVNETRHFGRAAAKCNVTQPTLSMQLQKLEEELGVVIFDRSKSPVIPTIEGEGVISQAEKTLTESRKLLKMAQTLRGGVQGKFKIGVIPTLSPYIVPLFAKRFSMKFPEVELTIEELKTDDVVDGLAHEHIDAGLVVTPLHDPSMIEKVLYYERFHLFVSKDHNFFTKKNVDQKELKIEEIWMLNKGNCFRDQVINICSDKKAKLIESLKFEGGSFETLKNMVLTSGGYTIFPQMAVDHLPETQFENVREFISPVPSREVSIVYSRSFHKEGIINAIHEEIVASIPKTVHSLRSENMKIMEIYR